MLLNVFVADLVGDNEPRGESTRNDIDPADLVCCYLDSYFDSNAEDTPGVAAVLDKLGRTYLCGTDDTRLHDGFLTELAKCKVAHTPEEDGCPPDCIKFDDAIPSPEP